MSNAAGFIQVSPTKFVAYDTVATIEVDSDPFDQSTPKIKFSAEVTTKRGDKHKIDGLSRAAIQNILTPD